MTFRPHPFSECPDDWCRDNQHFPVASRDERGRRTVEIAWVSPEMLWSKAQFKFRGPREKP